MAATGQARPANGGQKRLPREDALIAELHYSELVRSTGDIQHAIHRGVPRSTARGWLKSSPSEVITVDVTDMDILRLQQELLTLRKRVARLFALLRLLVVLLKLSGFSLAGTRIPNGAGKHTLMRAIERSTAVLPLRIVMTVSSVTP